MKDNNLIGSLNYKLAQMKRSFEYACEPLKMFLDSKLIETKYRLKRAKTNTRDIARKAIIGVEVGAIIIGSTLFISKLDESDFLTLKNVNRPTSQAEFWEAETPEYKDTIPQYMGADFGKVFTTKNRDNDNNYLRLMPNDNGRIYAYLDKSLSRQDVELITQSIEYFNDLFKKVNPIYHFEITFDEELFAQQRSQGNAVIHYGAQDELTLIKSQSSQTLGTAYEGFGYNREDGGSHSFLNGGKILIRPSNYNMLSNRAKLGTLNHEFMHMLGFKDSYKGYEYNDSLMFSDLTLWTNKLSPNDIRTLYALYSFDFIDENGNINYERMDQVKQQIQEYEREYFDDLIFGINDWMRKYPDYGKRAFKGFASKYMNGQEIGSEKFDYTALTHDDFQIEDQIWIRFDNDGTYTYWLKEDDYNTRYQGKVSIGNGYVAVPQIKDGKKTYYVFFIKDGDDLGALSLYRDSKAHVVGHYNEIEGYLKSNESGYEKD